MQALLNASRLRRPYRALRAPGSQPGVRAEPMPSGFGIGTMIEFPDAVQPAVTSTLAHVNRYALPYGELGAETHLGEFPEETQVTRRETRVMKARMHGRIIGYAEGRFSCEVVEVGHGRPGRIGVRLVKPGPEIVVCGEGGTLELLERYFQQQPRHKAGGGLDLKTATDSDNDELMARYVQGCAPDAIFALLGELAGFTDGVPAISDLMGSWSGSWEPHLDWNEVANWKDIPRKMCESPNARKYLRRFKGLLPLLVARFGVIETVRHMVDQVRWTLDHPRFGDRGRGRQALALGAGCLLMSVSWELLREHGPSVQDPVQLGEQAGAVLAMAFRLERTFGFCYGYWLDITPLPGTEAVHAEALAQERACRSARPSRRGRNPA